MFKKTKKEIASKAKVETLSNKELNNVVGGAINYNAGKSNTGSVTVGSPITPPVDPIVGNP
jgi:bacteriocin-like protein